MMADPFDIDDLRIDPTDPAYVGKTTVKSGKAKWRQGFVRVPWAWVDRLKVVNRAATYRVALLLLYGHWRNGGRPIRLSNAALIGEGVTRMSKSRALKELEQLGLIRVKRSARKSPTVTLKLIPKS
jgi:hypothetical protein